MIFFRSSGIIVKANDSKISFFSELLSLNDELKYLLKFVDSSNIFESKQLNIFKCCRLNILVRRYLKDKSAELTALKS